MSWFKVDDKLHDHRKVRKAGKSAMGVWVLAGSWSMFAEMDGFVPDSVLARWGTKRDAQTLVDVGFWDVAERNGESGWQFHDWLKYQPDARTLRSSPRGRERGRIVRQPQAVAHEPQGQGPRVQVVHRAPGRGVSMIAYPIGDPIGSRRVCPNRPRIARIESYRIGPFELRRSPCIPNLRARRAAMR
jgi:hypothetical protein